MTADEGIFWQRVISCVSAFEQLQAELTAREIERSIEEKTQPPAQAQKT